MNDVSDHPPAVFCDFDYQCPYLRLSVLGATVNSHGMADFTLGFRYKFRALVGGNAVLSQAFSTVFNGF